MENAFEYSNLPSNLSAELKNVQGDTRSDRKRKQRAVSNCWDHLTKINISGVAKAKCNHCGTVLTYGSRTINLNRHAKQIHSFNQ